MTPSGKMARNRHVVGLLPGVRHKVKVCRNSNRQPRQQARRPRLQIEERSERIDPPFAPSVSSVSGSFRGPALCPTAAWTPLLPALPYQNLKKLNGDCRFMGRSKHDVKRRRTRHYHSWIVNVVVFKLDAGPRQRYRGDCDACEPCSAGAARRPRRRRWPCRAPARRRR